MFSQPNLLDSNSTARGEADILLVPSATSTAPSLNESSTVDGGVEEYMDDVMTLPANLAGIPAITVPFSEKSQAYPIGLQLLGQYGYDKFLLYVAEQMTRK